GAVGFLAGGGGLVLVGLFEVVLGELVGVDGVAVLVDVLVLDVLLFLLVGGLGVVLLVLLFFLFLVVFLFLVRRPGVLFLVVQLVLGEEDVVLLFVGVLVGFDALGVDLDGGLVVGVEGGF